MKRFTQVIFPIGISFMVIILQPSPVQGSLFIAKDKTLQITEQRVMFGMNGDGTITTILDFEYAGDAESFGWLIPVPVMPEIEILDTPTLDNLKRETSVYFIGNVPDVCKHLHPYSNGGGAGGGDSRPFQYTGQLGPYDYTLLDNMNADGILTWLTANNYQITDDILPVIEDYLAQDWQFLALQFQRDTPHPAIQPIALTYSAEKSILPLQLSSAVAIENMPLLVWVFADTQYIPENYAHIDNMTELIRRPSAVFNIGKFIEDNNGSARLYQEKFDFLQAEYNGQMFITEYAQPTTMMAETMGNHNDVLLSDLVTQYDYVSFMRTQISPDQILLDPSFAPAETSQAISNRFDWSTIDPLQFYGCSSRTALLDINIDSLPSERAYFSDISLEVVYPTDWVLSELEIQGEPVFIYAPEAVSQHTIDAYFSGEPTPPIFIFTEIYHHVAEDLSGNDHEFALLTSLGQPRSNELPYQYGETLNDFINSRYDLTTLEDIEGVLLALLTIPDDWASNKAMYRAMLDYPRTYQYFSRPDIRHTLFIKDGFNLTNTFRDMNILQVPYPEDWQEFTDSEGNFVIALNGQENTPYLRLASFGKFYRELGTPHDQIEAGDYTNQKKQMRI